MAKRKKTRQQKIITSLRRQLQHSQPEENPVTSASNTTSYKFSYAPTQKTHMAETATYSNHLTSDLLKTVVITILLVVTELTLFILARTHVVSLPV